MWMEVFDGYQVKPFNMSAFLADVACLIGRTQL
jgi:hypothetical protein